MLPSTRNLPVASTLDISRAFGLSASSAVTSSAVQPEFRSNRPPRTDPLCKLTEKTLK